MEYNMNHSGFFFSRTTTTYLPTIITSKPDVIGNLVSKGLPSGWANITVTIDDKMLRYSFSSASKTTVKLETNKKWDDRHFIYILPREMFSLFEGFIGLSSKHEILSTCTVENIVKFINLFKLSMNSYIEHSITCVNKDMRFWTVFYPY